MNEWPDKCFYCGQYPLVLGGHICCICDPPDQLNFIVYEKDINVAIKEWNKLMVYANKNHKLKEE